MLVQLSDSVSRYFIERPGGTTKPVESEFLAICNHCGVMAA